MVQSATSIKSFSYLCTKILASTMSVDEYFDELIDKVREDYANL